MTYRNRSRVQGFPLKAGFKGCVHHKPACKSSPPAKVKYAGQVFNSIARKFGKRKVTLNGEPGPPRRGFVLAGRTCERLRHIFP